MTHQPTELLGALITPAVLISAAALLQLSTANRVGRVNDRLRELIKETERSLSQGEMRSASDQKYQFNLKQLAVLQERLQLLRSAASAIYVTIAILVVTSIAAGINVLFPQLPNILPMSLGMLGAVGFLYSILLLVLEASIAVRVTSAEIAYVRELLERLDRAQVQRHDREANFLPPSHHEVLQ